mmetsp:Transcript_24647/g.84291  ORF Transcript_24647/g.84291 Transcript_24647/m.84291 type:complete len:426 (+) Transcript_24647:232-1509(+)
MKRAAEQSGWAPPAAKRPAGGGATASSAQPRLTQQDALSYLRSVKERFKDERSVYETFLEVMKEFKSKKINTEGVIARVKFLFRGNRELILGFNTFLPKGYEIDLPPDGEEPKPKQPVEFDQAISYVNKIKTRFQDNEKVYKSFLEILNMYRKGNKTISQVYDEVALLFDSHDDLLREFTYFLPDNTQPQRVPGQPKKAGGARGVGAAKPGWRSDRGGPAGRSVAGGALKRKAGARAPKGEAGRAAEEYAPEVAKAEAGKGAQAANLQKELGFFDKVKQRLRNRDAYQEFLKCLNVFNQEIITKMELQGLVYDILGRHPDLLSGFNDFLSRCESMDLDQAPKEGKLTAKDLQKMKIVAAREKYLSRPISELDLSQCERCGPSFQVGHFSSAQGKRSMSGSELRDLTRRSAGRGWNSACRVAGFRT